MANTITTAPAKSNPLTSWDGDRILQRYMDALPEPQSEAHNQARAAIETGNYEICKVLASIHLSDSYIKAIGYLSSVPKVCAAGLPTLPTLLSEAARACADAWVDLATSSEKNTGSVTQTRNTKLGELGVINQDIFEKALEKPLK